MIPVGHQIYLKRLERNKTQAELAKLAGIPQPNLSNIEKGKRDVTVSTLRKIAVALNIHPAEFFLDFDQGSSKDLSRSKIESLAKQVANENPAKRVKDPAVALYQKVLPYQGRVRVRELQKSWLELKKQFTSREIENVQQRVEEHRKRSHEQTSN